jgi:hypothetical protein
MADSFKMQFDGEGWQKAFDALDGPVKEHLSRRMLVDGGVLLRDAAKSNARMAANIDGTETRGMLANAIYLVYVPEDATPTSYTYKISWNARKAPHGHLIEFGHWITHAVFKASNGEWYTDKDQPLNTPRWVPARPFLRPTFDSYSNVAISAMIQRGKKELPLLLAEYMKP